MSEFKIPPISTLIGSGPLNYWRVMRHAGTIDSAFYFKFILTTLVVALSAPFHLYEKLYFKSKVRKYKLSKPPLFILGHWRSGTTFLHNMLCIDPDAGYLTTYQSVFPNNLASKFIYKKFMKMNMPDKRPSDNVKLGIDLPQEDEFALSNITDRSFYHFFYFPRLYRMFYKKSVDDVNDDVTPEWDSQYRQLIIKAMINTSGKRAVIKNPVNTARIKSILRIFPDAKFIFIYRNPITVFLSTQKFFRALFPTLWFHKVDHDFIDAMIYDNFTCLMRDYENQKHLVPSENLIELRFEDFEANPIEQCRAIYTDLLHENFEPIFDYFENFISEQKSYTKNKYVIPATLVDKIYEEWGEYMKKWSYDIPKELVVEK